MTTVMVGHEVSGTEISVYQSAPPWLGAHAGLFIVGGQRSDYNALNVPKYLPRQ
jgi:hypothetical protein